MVTDEPDRRIQERVAQVVFYAALLLIGWLAFRIVRPFLSPLGWAGVAAVSVYPVFERLQPRLGRSRAAAVCTLLVVVLLVAPAWIVAAALLREGSQAVASLQQTVRETPPDMLQTAWNWLQTHVPMLEPERLSESIGDVANRVAGAVAAGSGALLGGVAVWLFQLVVTLFALFFFLRDSETIVRTVRGLLPFEEAQKDRVLGQAGDLIFASVIAGLAIAAAQGALGGLTFWILGIRAPIVWGTVMAFLSLIPMVGSWLIWLPVAIWLLATGEVARGVILIAVGAGLVGSVDNVLRPMLLSGRAAMNGLVTFVSLLGGVAAFGFIGLIMGPVVIAVSAALLDAFLRPVVLPPADDMGGDPPAAG